MAVSFTHPSRRRAKSAAPQDDGGVCGAPIRLMALLSFAIAVILMGGVVPNTGAEMRSDEIEAVGIDGDGSLWVKPATCTFPFIYRAAMEVNWADGRQCLYAPKPREWSYSKWFRQIINAARSEYGAELRIVPTTSWSNVGASLRQEISTSLDGG